MEILVFGLENENSILSALRKRFPSVGFKKYDLSKEIEDEGRRLVVIDTLKGIGNVMLIDDIHSLSAKKALDGSGAVMTLRILLRIGSIDSVRLIAVPERYPEEDSLAEVCAAIKSLLGTSGPSP